jgi:hypothetical protein
MGTLFVEKTWNNFLYIWHFQKDLKATQNWLFATDVSDKKHDLLKKQLAIVPIIIIICLAFRIKNDSSACCSKHFISRIGVDILQEEQLYIAQKCLWCTRIFLYWFIPKAFIF